MRKSSFIWYSLNSIIYLFIQILFASSGTKNWSYLLIKKTPNFLKVIPLAMVVCSSILVSTAKPASAFGCWKTDYLGRATIRDNSRYARSIERIATGTPPWNRNNICRWKYPRRNGTVYGKAASWWGRANWETNCYHRYWRWW